MLRSLSPGGPDDVSASMWKHHLSKTYMNVFAFRTPRLRKCATMGAMIMLSYQVEWRVEGSVECGDVRGVLVWRGAVGNFATRPEPLALAGGSREHGPGSEISLLGRYAS
jgi:hypothetical protein